MVQEYVPDEGNQVLNKALPVFTRVKDVLHRVQGVGTLVSRYFKEILFQQLLGNAPRHRQSILELDLVIAEG